MTISSQAGLASLRHLGNIVPDNKLIILPSATFELKLGRDNRWSVIAVHRTLSGTAQAMVGMTFTPGDSPMCWAQGYAMRIQAEINKWE